MSIEDNSTKVASNLLLGQPENTKKPRVYKGNKLQLSYNGDSLSVAMEVRYAKTATDAIFKPDEMLKCGPNGGELRWDRGGSWGIFEKQADGTEVAINNSDIKYYQEVDGQKVEVEPFDSTKSLEILEGRPLDQCTLDGENALGSLMPDNMENNFGPDGEKGTKLYEIWSEKGNPGLIRVLEKMEKDKVKLFFPFVFRKGMSIHLCVAKVVRLDSAMYLTMRTYAGPALLTRTIVEGEGVAERTLLKPVLAKPVLRTRSLGV